MGNYGDPMFSPALFHGVLVCVVPDDENKMEVHTQSFHGFEKHMDTSAIAPRHGMRRHGRDYHYPWITSHCLKRFEIHLFGPCRFLAGISILIVDRTSSVCSRGAKNQGSPVTVPPTGFALCNRIERRSLRTGRVT